MSYLKMLKNIDLTKFKEILEELKKITKKNKAIIIFDIIKCSLLYGAGYHDYYYYEFYNLNHQDRKAILTRVKNNKIIKTFNNKDYAELFEDKSLFLNTFKDYVKRDFIKLGSNEKEFIQFFKENKNIVLKPLNETGGTGVELKTYKDEDKAKEIYRSALSNDQLLAEEYIVQHEKLNELYDKTINTLRIFTFYNNGKPKVVYSILKIGRTELKDNFCSGGMYVLLNKEGTVISDAIDMVDDVYESHPVSKLKFKGYQVPLYDEVVKLTTEAAKVIKEVQYIGWDVAISTSGPMLVEGNYYPGVFQMKPSLTTEYKLANHLEKELKIKL